MNGRDVFWVIIGIIAIWAGLSTIKSVGKPAPPPPPQSVKQQLNTWSLILIVMGILLIFIGICVRNIKAPEEPNVVVST